MKKSIPKKLNLYKYILWALVGYIGILTGYHSFNIIRYFLKPVNNPLIPLDYYKYIAFPYTSLLPFLFALLALGFYFIRKNYFGKATVIFYALLILILHISQNSLFELFDGFNPYA